LKLKTDDTPAHSNSNSNCNFNFNFNFNWKADIWSLGCVFYEMAMLERPFVGKSLQGMLKNVVTCRYPPMVAKVPADVRSLVESLLQPAPDQVGGGGGGIHPGGRVWGQHYDLL
jgi:serine/threonine protein kinase